MHRIRPPGARRASGAAGEMFAAPVRDVADPHVAQRWAAVSGWSRRVPLPNDGSVR